MRRGLPRFFAGVATWFAMLAVAVAAEPVTLSSAATGEPYKPDGAGRFPAVVVLHGCGGVTAHGRAWAQRLNSWGYVALVVDSFGPRGFPNGVCTAGNLGVPPDARVADAFAAAAWLRAQPFVEGRRLGVIGFSHGGSTVLRAIVDPTVQVAEGTSFRAAVAYYPRCLPNLAPVASDTMILIGDADEAAAAARCVEYAAAQPDQPHPIEIKVYPGAAHAFDVVGEPRSPTGFLMAYDPAAAEDSFAMTRRFFDARLK